MRIKIQVLLLVLGGTFVACGGKKDTAQPNTVTTTGTTTGTAPVVDKGWSFESTPSFSDEFDKSGMPDTAKWSYDTGGNGWGNNELEYYTSAAANAGVANGMLSITARQESYGGNNYTSARLVSKFAASLQYGRVEVRAKIPAGRGMWPAIWMLPDTYAYGAWPNSGEIDIMENVGYDPNPVYFTIHTQLYNGAIGTQKGANISIPDASTTFHKYRMDWTPYAVKAYYDDQLLFTYVNAGTGTPSWPFDQKFHLLLNVAVGGSWGGAKGVDNTAFPAAMQVDYVRFYKMINQ